MRNQYPALKGLEKARRVMNECTVSALLLALVAPSLCQKNVLFIMSDDLRPQLNSYKNANGGEGFPSSVSPTMYTPYTDTLADDSILFTQAYNQYALCGPSRTSLLTGRRPDSTKVYDITTYWRDVSGNFTTIPQHFKNQGYYTVGMGKIFHEGDASGGDSDGYSWSEPFRDDSSNFKNYWRPQYGTESWRAVPASEQALYPLRDEEIKNDAVDKITELAPAALSHTQHFFLAVGFHLPHLPWYFPERFLTDIDNYLDENISLPPRRYSPVDMPSVAYSSPSELRGYDDIASISGWDGSMNNTLDDDHTKALRGAYYATVSYVDELVGDLLRALDDNGLTDDTIVVLTSDHGWHLGDLGAWCKKTNFDYATQVPLMIKVPGLTDGGIVSGNLVELTDLFPTLVDLTGIDSVSQCTEANAQTEVLCHEGTSLVPLISEPATTSWRTAAFSQIKANRKMGYSIRTDQYRYTRWMLWDDATYTYSWTGGVDEELYDLVSDPEESENIADDSSYLTIIKSLRKTLKAGWHDALPSSRKRALTSDGRSSATNNMRRQQIEQLLDEILSPS